MVRFLLIWAAVSVPVSLLVGALLAASTGEVSDHE